jgi:hypothetical protein
MADLDRIARLEARVFGHDEPGNPALEAHERKAHIANLYLAYLRGQIERPELEHPDDLATWEKMRVVQGVAEGVARRVAAKGYRIGEDGGLR